jgi:hypothetical protein
VRSGTYGGTDVAATIIDRDATGMISCRITGSGALKCEADTWFVPDTALVPTTPTGRPKRVWLTGHVQRPASGNRPSRIITKRVSRVFEPDQFRGRKARPPAAVRATLDALEGN